VGEGGAVFDLENGAGKGGGCFWFGKWGRGRGFIWFGKWGRGEGLYFFWQMGQEKGGMGGVWFGK
jgi:hypothetical protein